MKLKQLMQWYLELPEVASFKSVKSRESSVKRSFGMLGVDREVSSITSLDLLALQKRFMAMKMKPATVNKEMCYITNALKLAMSYGIDKVNEIYIKPMKVVNVRERMLSVEQLKVLLSRCHPLIRNIVMLAYWTPMRRSEILDMQWPSVLLDRGFIKQGWDGTKKQYSRAIPLHPAVLDMLRTIKRDLGHVFVYHDGSSRIPNTFLDRQFRKAIQECNFGDFVFHDLRHCAANNMRMAGNDLLVIMKAGGWKSVQALQRYLFVTEEEITNVKWISGG